MTTFDNYPVAQGRYNTPDDFYFVFFKTPDGRSCGIGPNGGPVGCDAVPADAPPGTNQTDRQQLGARGVPPLGHRVLHPRRRRSTRGVPPGELGCDLRSRRRGPGALRDLQPARVLSGQPATASSGSGSAPRRSPASPGCRRGWPGRRRGRSRAACAPVRVRCCGSRTAPSSHRGRRPGSTRARRWCGRRRHRFARPAAWRWLRSASAGDGCPTPPRPPTPDPGTATPAEPRTVPKTQRRQGE